MRYKSVAPFSKQMTIIIGLSVVAFMAFGLALSYYKNILFDQQLTLMRERNHLLRERIVAGEKELAYLASPQYKDKYAKEHFSLSRPGEKVLIVAEDDISTFPLHDLHIPTEEEKEALLFENLRLLPIIDHWKMFLFYPERIDAFRQKITNSQ